jgi:hypothetical protein
MLLRVAWYAAQLANLGVATHEMSFNGNPTPATVSTAHQNDNGWHAAHLSGLGVAAHVTSFNDNSTGNAFVSPNNSAVYGYYPVAASNSPRLSTNSFNITSHRAFAIDQPAYFPFNNQASYGFPHNVFTGNPIGQSVFPGSEAYPNVNTGQLPVYVHPQLQYPIATYNGIATANTANTSEHNQLFNELPAMSTTLSPDTAPTFLVENNPFIYDVTGTNHGATNPNVQTIGNNTTGRTRVDGIPGGYAVDNGVGALHHADTENSGLEASWNVEL